MAPARARCLLLAALPAPAALQDAGRLAAPPSPPAPPAPFVEDVRVLHDSLGEAAGDQYGWVARRVGDLDADGFADFASTAPSHGVDRGLVLVFSGRGGERLFRWVGEPGEQLGWAVAAAGDQDGDGHDDVLVGAPSASGGPGRAYVRSGRDGELLLTLEGEGPAHQFGKDLAAIGDLDGDGRSELCVGAPGCDAAGGQAGRAYLFHGGDGEILMDFDGAPGDQLGESVTGFVRGELSRVVLAAPRTGAPAEGYLAFHDARTGERVLALPAPPTARNMAWFLSVVGDVNADGVPDVYHTDWMDALEGPNTGRATVSSGDDGRTLLELTGRAGTGFGIGVGDAGDLDGDGADDLVIGAWTHGGGARSGGKVFLYSGRDARPLGAFTGAVAGATLGFDATGLGDLDGDGVPDLLVTAAWDPTRGAKAGRTLVVSGASVLAAGARPEDAGGDGDGALPRAGKARDGGGDR